MVHTLPEDAGFRRVILAHVDLEAALEFAEVLVADKRRTDRDRGVVREALTIAAIMAYARPFKESKGDGGRTARLIKFDDVGPWSEYQQRYHRQLITWRDQIVAHSDPGPRQLRIEHSPFFGKVPMMRDVAFRMDARGARELRGHISNVLSFLSAKLAAGGIEGLGFES